MPLTVETTTEEDTNNVGQVAAYVSKNHSKKSLSEGLVLLPICLGQEYHTGKKLEAILRLLQGTRRIIVLITGGLYRHTKQITNPLLSAEEACREAIKDGEEWEREHKSILDSCGVPVTIYHWDAWLLHPKYPVFRDKIEEFYMLDAGYRQAYDEEAGTFLKRLQNKHHITDPEEAYRRCRRYIQEEAAAISTVYKYENQGEHYTHLVYPGSQSSAIYETFKKLELSISWVHVKFTPSVTTTHIKYISVLYKTEDRIRMMIDRDIEARELGERTDLLRKNRVFCVEGAAPNIRNAVINSKVLPAMENYAMSLQARVDTKKTTHLIFSTIGGYNNNKFAGESWTKHKPSRRIDLSIPSSLDSSAIIDLRDLQAEENRRHLLTLHNELNSWMKQDNDLKNIAEALGFLCPWLVYNELIPEATFVHIEDEEKQYGFYFSNPLWSVENKVYELPIVMSLSPFGVHFEHQFVSKKSTADAEAALLIQVIDPILLAKLFFDLCISIMNKATSGSTHIHSVSSTPTRKSFVSPQVSPSGPGVPQPPNFDRFNSTSSVNSGYRSRNNSDLTNNELVGGRSRAPSVSSNQPNDDKFESPGFGPIGSVFAPAGYGVSNNKPSPTHAPSLFAFNLRGHTEMTLLPLEQRLTHEIPKPERPPSPSLKKG
jgi:hypothetical protein